MALSGSILFHNPRCSKSREALALLEKKEVDVKVVEYLKDPYSEADLKSLLKLLDMEPSELARKKDDLYGELKLSGKSEAEHLKAMVKHPALVERPIFFHNKKAVVGRPPENVLEIL